jgi:hypothetical protein
MNSTILIDSVSAACATLWKFQINIISGQQEKPSY